MNINIQMLSLILAVAGTLIAKYIWDRWLSQASRITEQKCRDNQAVCFLNVVAKINEATTQISKLSEELSCGDATFEAIKLNNEKTARTLKLILLTLSELCMVGEGCEEQTKRRIEEELLR